jgi:hypothetical protein
MGKGFAEWYGPPRAYDEALWPSDPFYDPQGDPIARMVQCRRGDPGVTQLEQLALDWRKPSRPRLHLAARSHDPAAGRHTTFPASPPFESQNCECRFSMGQMTRAP